MLNKNRLFISLLGGFLFCIDQVLKYFARTNQATSFIWRDIVGWEYFENPGIAFSLPVPNLVIVLLTPLIIFGLFVWILRNPKMPNKQYLSLSLIIAGAISNFIDRMMLGITVDYLRIYTSIINLADIMIVTGVIILLLKTTKKALLEEKNF